MDRYLENVSLVDSNTRNVVSTILRILEPEKIICFGRRISERKSWSTFVPKDEKSSTVIYDLLIITSVTENRSAHELLDMIDSSFADEEVKAMVLIHSIQSVNQALSAGSTFFSTVCRSGAVLYDKGGTPMLSARTSDGRSDSFQIEQVWHESFGLARQFLNGALHFSWSGCNNIALFMLHQAIEQTCNALVRVMTGYRPATHNLSRLLAMTENFCTLSSELFPRNTPEENKIFSIVARAYSDVRYKPGFEVSDQQAMTIIQRVSSLQRGAERLYRDKMDEAARYRNHKISNSLK